MISRPAAQVHPIRGDTCKASTVPSPPSPPLPLCLSNYCAFLLTSAFCSNAYLFRSSIEFLHGFNFGFYFGFFRPRFNVRFQGTHAHILYYYSSRFNIDGKVKGYWNCSILRFVWSLDCNFTLKRVYWYIKLQLFAKRNKSFQRVRSTRVCFPWWKWLRVLIDSQHKLEIHSINCILKRRKKKQWKFKCY